MGTTLENLQAAFNGESNANAKYTVFARKADEEGYTQVASLFRAAAAAEALHAAAHDRVIRRLGAEPKAVIEAAHAGATDENLKAAIAGESYERDVMYPEFIKVAAADQNQAAVQTFERAMKAEAEHARMYQEALDHLASRKGGKRDYWVCQSCGFTLDVAPPANCPACGARKERFALVN